MRVPGRCRAAAWEADGAPRRLLGPVRGSYLLGGFADGTAGPGSDLDLGEQAPARGQSTPASGSYPRAAILGLRRLIRPRTAMRELARLTEHDMIAAFVRAELDSERFGPAVRAASRRHRVPRRVVEHPDTADARQNAQRLAILRDYRRYGLDRSLFDGFPYDGVAWTRVALGRDEVLAIRYIDYDYWVELSGGSRLPSEAARRILAGEADPAHTAHWLRVARALDRGAAFPELIAVTAGGGAPLVALEGHLRLTAYALRPEHIPDPLTAILGSSPHMPRWGCY
jgi:hypothetical protein